MKNLRRSILFLLLSGCASLGLKPESRRAPSSNAHQAPKELTDLLGVYSGCWEFSKLQFDRDGSSKVVPGDFCSDNLEMKDPEVTDAAAVANTTDAFICNGVPLKYPFKGKEGFYLNADQIGDRFFTTVIADSALNNRTIDVIETPIKTSSGSLAYAYEIPLSAHDFGPLGIEGLKNVTGVHYGIKRESVEDGVVFDRVTRLTSLKWTNKNGKTVSKTFVSLQGFHRPGKIECPIN